METLATVSGSISENVLVIHDSEPKTLIIWLFMMCIVFILYCVVTTVHDIHRNERLEEIRKELERKKEERDLEKL